MTVSEAARQLRTSPQTIRNFLREGTLKGRKRANGTWQVRQASVDAFLIRHGRLNGGRRRKSADAALRHEVSRLQEHVARLDAVGREEDAIPQLLAERDDLRARVAQLEDAVARLREASEFQRRADAERSRVIGDLQAALDAAERADALRLKALATLEDGLAGNLIPSTPGAIRR